MMRKMFRAWAFLTIVTASVPVLAQQAETGALDDPQLIAARELLQAGRADIIRDEIRFTESEAAAFWPAYEKYRADIMEVRDRHTLLVTDYLTAYRLGTVSEADAERFVDDVLEIKGDLLRLQKRHLKYFRKALPARKAARFYQLENKLDAELEAQLARFVPLVDTQ